MSDRKLPTDDDIDELTRTIETTPWEVEDWELDTGMYDATTLTVEVTWAPQSPQSATERQQLQTAKEVVERLEADHEEGAPVLAVITELTDMEDVDRRRAKALLDSLRQRGEVYEPTKDTLRVT